MSTRLPDSKNEEETHPAITPQPDIEEEPSTPGGEPGNNITAFPVKITNYPPGVLERDIDVDNTLSKVMVDIELAIMRIDAIIRSIPSRMFESSIAELEKKADECDIALKYVHHCASQRTFESNRYGGLIKKEHNNLVQIKQFLQEEKEANRIKNSQFKRVMKVILKIASTLESIMREVGIRHEAIGTLRGEG